MINPIDIWVWDWVLNQLSAAGLLVGEEVNEHEIVEVVREDILIRLCNDIPDDWLQHVFRAASKYRESGGGDTGS